LETVVLSPYRVLDLSDEQGLICGQILADLGADVVAVEDIRGSSARRMPPFAAGALHPEQSLYWQAYNRDKRSVALDFRSQAGLRRLHELVAEADVFIESEPNRGEMPVLGLGYTALSRMNPALVYVSISAFGRTGPKAGWAATELTVWAASGAMAPLGDGDRAPLRVSVPQSWLHAGALAAVGALVALHERSRSGRGQRVDVSAQQATAHVTMSTVLAAAWGTPQYGRGAAVRSPRTRTLFEAADGYLMIGPLFGPQGAPRTARLMEHVYAEGFCDAAMRGLDWATIYAEALSGARDPRDVEAVQDAIEAYTRAHTKEELFAIARTEGLWLAPVRTIPEMLTSEQLAARAYWQDLRLADGKTVKTAGPFIRLGRLEQETTPKATAIARLGEHTEEVLAEPPRAQPTAVPESDADELPLAGLRILDLSWVMAGPAAVRLLADWGAEIVHVESSRRIDLARTSMLFKDGKVGLETSGWWHNLSAGRMSVTVDPATPEGREVILDLARWADVAIESFSPAVMQRWNLAYPALHEVNPRLVMLSSSLMGQTGPERLYAALGTQAASLMGFVDVTGWPDRAPTPPAGAYTDTVAPWFTAAALLAAVDEARRMGRGRYLDLAQGESALQFLAPAILDYTVNGHYGGRAGNDDLTMAPHGVFPVAGPDRWVAIACRDDQDWRSLVAIIGPDSVPEDLRVASAPERMERRREIDAIVAVWTAVRDEHVVVDRLQASGIPAHVMQTSRDCLADPQLAHRQHFVTVEHKLLGPITIEGTRFKLSRSPSNVTRPGPQMGEHNEHVLRDILGYSEDRIAVLVAAGALA
jgi:crotonobetainyl-CoA:carnitine CoA-transferase CaiB-like acyl-CoA transferase